MSDAPSIKFSKNGPIIVKNVTNLSDADGKPIEAREKMFLCRCGQSANKPFCDGSHNKVGWNE